MDLLLLRFSFVGLGRWFGKLYRTAVPTMVRIWIKGDAGFRTAEGIILEPNEQPTSGHWSSVQTGW